MPKHSVLSDLVASAGAAKVHYEVWWAQVSEAKPALVRQMNVHSDFFRASCHAHYLAFHVCLAHLFDKTPRTASIQSYLHELESSIPASELQALKVEYEQLARRAKPVIVARHKTIAHIDSVLTEKEAYLKHPITYNQIRDVIYDSAQFVAKLAGHADDPGVIGIARTRRLLEATLKLIDSLPIK